MGRSGSRRGQLLYPLVYVASLTLVAVSSAALALLGHDHVIDAAVQVAVVDDQATVRGFVASTKLGDEEGVPSASVMRASVRPEASASLVPEATVAGDSPAGLARTTPKRGERTTTSW